MNNIKELQALRKALTDWYRINQRALPWRETADPYAIWVSEVMLQQTQVTTVLPYYHNFLWCFPSLKSLAQTNLEQVLKAWEGLGYYARARNLHKAAGVVLNQHEGIIPQNWQDFRELPGVGDYIAAAVLSIAFGHPHPVVDGNVKRVLARMLAMETPVNQSPSNKIFQQTAAQLLDAQSPGRFNQAVMELGAMICRPFNPLCPACPVQAWCCAYQTNQISEFPKRIKKQAPPQYQIAVGVVFKKGRVLITRRKPDGLLGGLWEFPGGKIKPRENAKAACIREIKEEVNLAVRVDSHLCRIHHAYTHFKIRMEVFCCQYVAGRVNLRGPVDHRWIKLDQLEKYPLPKANHKFLSQLKDWYSKHGDPKINATAKT
jgi:A/G-specific adenine glycosylase